MNDMQSLTAERAEVMLAFSRDIDVLARGMGDVRDQWHSCKFPDWDWSSHDYKVAPRRPIERWVNVYNEEGTECFAHESLEHADKFAGVNRIRCVRMIEVVDEKED